MGIPQYLAKTERETLLYPDDAGPIAWLGCSFGKNGLTGLPEVLPAGSLLVLDDSVPMADQSIPDIADALQQTLAKFSCCGLLLDFQQQGCAQQRTLAEYLAAHLSHPIAAPQEYAPKGCALFVPPVPPEIPIETYLAPWAGREIWLDMALSVRTLHLTAAGCSVSDDAESDPTGDFYDESLCCVYRIQKTDDGFLFRLARDHRCTRALLDRAAGLGVTAAVGLWQEFRV